jgi:peptide/nickel transport system substrate-binding protein
MSVRRKRHLRPVTVLATLGLLALPGGTALASPLPASGPVQGGNLSVDLVGASWGSLDTASPYTGLATWPAQSLIFDPLIKEGPNGTLLPDLATSWKFSPDGKTLTIHLRQGVKFQDGTPFNAAAVAFNLERQVAPANHSLCAPNLTVMTKATALNSSTVELTLSSPDQALPSVLAETGCAFMASPTAVQKEGAQFGNHPVGTGPFEFESQAVGSTLTVKKNPNYWQKGEPHLDSVTLHLLTSGTTAYEGLQSGSVQVLPYSGNVDPVVLQQALQDSSLNVLKEPAIAYDYIRWEVGKGPFTNVKAREAVDYATNQAQLSKELDYGLYQPITSPLAKSSWAYTASSTSGYPSYNLSKAKALVKQIGGLSFTLDFNNSTAFLSLAEALRAQWSQAGIKATLQPMDFTTLLTMLHAGNYQGLMNGWAGGGDPDSDLYFQFHSGQISSDHYDDPKIDALLTEAREKTTRAGRKAVYAQFSEEWNRYVPWDLLPANPGDVIMAKSVHGFTDYDGLTNWTNVWLQG